MLKIPFFLQGFHPFDLLIHYIKVKHLLMLNKVDRIQFLSNNTKVKGLKHVFEAEISTKKFIMKNSMQLF